MRTNKNNSLFIIIVFTKYNNTNLPRGTNNHMFYSNHPNRLLDRYELFLFVLLGLLKHNTFRYHLNHMHRHIYERIRLNLEPEQFEIKGKLTSIHLCLIHCLSKESKKV